MVLGRRATRKERFRQVTVSLEEEPRMPLMPASAKVTEIEVSHDVVPVEIEGISVMWANVTIHYALQGSSPEITIRVPVEVDSNSSPGGRRAQALQSARALLNHACTAPGMTGSEKCNETENPAPNGREAGPLEGLAQELGLVSPRTRSSRSKISAG
jgi:hypothetical protein